MSRSYRNFPSRTASDDAEVVIWSKMRTRERNCIGKELRSYEYGDVMFPRYKRSDGYGCCTFSRHRYWVSINNIRNEYYAEINRILNSSYKAKSPLEYLEWIEWLNQRETRNVIANWTGDPPHVLYYLARHGYVERAVRNREKELKGFGYTYDYRGNRSSISNPDNNRAVRERIEKRKVGIENRRREKERKLEAEMKASECLTVIKRVLQKDNTAKKRESKRPGPGKFTGLFSFMMTEERLAACQDWRAHTFNERKQYFEFIRDCIYPYPIPEALIFTSILPDYMIDDKKKRMHKSPDYDTIALSRRWLQDIASGDSFYKRNRGLFTRAEAHHFLASKIASHNPSSVLELYFQAKCKAHHFSPALSLMVSRIFSDRFSKYLNYTLITGFFDFIARNKEHLFTTSEMIDISDFVLSKITRYDQHFSFSGRTLSSLITLANEWHIDQQHRMVISKKDKYQFWAGLPVPDFLHETEDALWEIKQLRTAKDLFAEGQNWTRD